MTYRELLKLYQEGKLDEEQKQEVEQSGLKLPILAALSVVT